MARIKATCSKCGETILLFFDPDKDLDYKEIVKLKAGESFEHKCPSCGNWAAFKIPEEAHERDVDLRGITSPETHPEWSQFLTQMGFTAEQYAIGDKLSKDALRQEFRRKIRRERGEENAE